MRDESDTGLIYALEILRQARDQSPGSRSSTIAIYSVAASDAAL
jgi:hypothetical protein